MIDLVLGHSCNMVREISRYEIDMLDVLIQKYVAHKKEDGVTPDTVKGQMQRGLTKETHLVLMDETTEGDALGFLVINLESDRIPVLFADWNFEIEKKLLDYAFNKLSATCSHISFESGYPTPWLTDELSSYVITLGFVKHTRAFMQLMPIDKEILTKCATRDELEFVPFEENMVSEISKLVFKCVDGTTDQDLFPFVYSTTELVEKFLQDFISGSFGTHEPYYSWVLRENTGNIGACFLMTNEETGGLMHIVIDPEYRQQGLGKTLLCHSLSTLLRINPSVNRITLAVTLSNKPAIRIYDSLGFKVLNDASTFVWKA